MRRAAVLGLCWALAPCGWLSAQTERSIAAGVGTVRASDGSTAGAFTVSPALHVNRAATLIDAQLTWAVLHHGDLNAQVRLEGWQRVGPAGDGTRLAIAAMLAGSALPGAARSGSGHVLLELFSTRRGNGVALGAGPVIGAIGGADPTTGMRVRARAWVQAVAVQPSAGLEATWLRDTWYTDGFASATWVRGPVTATISAACRVVEDGATRATGGAFVAWQLGHRVALEGSVGGFPSDPLLGFARATAVNVGARLSIGRSVDRGAAPLLARTRDGAVVVRIRMRGAASVAIAGEWTGWTTVPLQRVKPGSDLWEAVLALTPGTYRFNVIVDGTRWTLPEGVASVPDGLGGRVGLLVVVAPRHDGVR